MQRYTVYFIWKLLYMFRVVPPPIIRRANKFIYSIWYLSHRYCYLSPSWMSWNWFECAVGRRTPPTAHSNRFQLFHDSGQDGRSRVRFPMVSLEFFIDIDLPAAL